MCVCVHNRYLVLLLLLLGKVAAVCVEFDNVLAHVVHSVHQELKALLQVVAGGGKRSACQSHTHTVSGKDDYKDFVGMSSAGQYLVKFHFEDK